MSPMLFPTQTRLKVFAEVAAGEVRWFHFVTPEARNRCTDRVRTAEIRAMAEAGLVAIPDRDPVKSYVTVVSTEMGKAWAALDPKSRAELDAWHAAWVGPGSTSPEPGPPPSMQRPVEFDVIDEGPIERVTFVRAPDGPVSLDDLDAGLPPLLLDGPPRPPYGSAERVAYDAAHGPAPWMAESGPTTEDGA